MNLSKYNQIQYLVQKDIALEFRNVNFFPKVLLATDVMYE